MVGDNEIHIDLRQIILAIETAVSLVGMNDTNHGKRVGYIASQLGHVLGFSEEDIRFVFELGMLHDCGVSSEQVHSNLVNHFDWEDAHIHCEIGYKLLRNFTPLAKYAVPILYHHTPWSELSKMAVSSFDARMANLIFISDRIDVLCASHAGSDILIARSSIVESVKSYAGTYFDPAMVEAFLTIEGAESFWITLDDRHITRYVWEMGNVATDQWLSLGELKHLSLILAYIVDQKSPFTAQHSVRVAGLSKFLASQYGLSGEQSAKVEIAGLLHDLGKLHMPDNILEKPGPLDPSERAVMRQHSFETFEILRHIKGMEEIARWAAFHHEEVAGGGYPFHLKAKELTIESRIIAAADIFQALVQNRPYRKGMALNDVLETIDTFAKSGKLDTGVVQLIKRHAEQCYRIAGGSENSDSYLQLFGE